MLPNKIAFIDVETTGTRSSYDRIIEIGILRVENNTLVKTFKSLINPQSYLPKEITKLTGIEQKDIENAPTFRAVKDEIFDILQDCTFVAHNVRFDYAFVKHEFLRERITYSAKQFCTVRLSRILYPQWQRHNLDAVIQGCNISCENRHRAFDDAQVLFEFYKHLLKNVPLETLEQALAKTMKKPSLPINLPIEELDKLPEKPGVYIFYGEDDRAEKNKKQNDPQIPLYVGKSVNIRGRVLSHFSSDITSATEMHIAQQVKRIETITTAGELGALILESQLIKELLPIYNKRSRIKHELIAVKKRTTNEGYDECYLEPITKINADCLSDFLGFFRSRKQAKATLADLAKTHMLCEKLLGLEKTSSSCFAYRLDRCKGACIGKEKALIYNLKLQTAFSENKILPWPFDGPILIQESEGVYDEFGLNGKHEYFIIDNWCYLGTVIADSEGTINNKEIEDVAFDLDVYKILRQFLRNPGNEKKIKVMKARREKMSATKLLIPHR
ncbi:MAG TPA: exonuclease domain-containing protein [Candidatus Saccharimonadales bacterium]|nr:exonuclease domain-containing protein [Candidatus Saccharimonadales bacterium]